MDGTMIGLLTALPSYTVLPVIAVLQCAASRSASGTGPARVIEVHDFGADEARSAHQVHSIRCDRAKAQARAPIRAARPSRSLDSRRRARPSCD